MGETINGSNFSTVCGGKGLNQAVAVGRMGGNARFLGAVGNDDYGNRAIKCLQESGIDCSYIKKTAANTGVAVITVCGGDNHIILDSGANACVTPQLIEENQELFDWADTIIMQLEIPMESVILAAKMAKKHNTKVVLNPAPANELPCELYEYIDVLVPNQSEAENLVGFAVKTNEDRENAVKQLVFKGVGQVIITLGKDGCVFNQNDKIIFQNAFEVKSVDSTAAGDSFIGGLCVSLAKGEPIEQAVPYATAISAITVSKPGASVSIPKSNEVDEFLDANVINCELS